MEVCIQPTEQLNGEAAVPASKSITIRALIAGLLSEGRTTVKNPLKSLDTLACVKAAQEFGAKITESGGDCMIEGTGGRISAPKKPVDTLNSGTTIRIMTAVAALASDRITLTGDESIRRRPIKPLLSALSDLGVYAESTNGFPPHTVRGPLVGGACSIPGDTSSQFISGLLMAAPRAHADTVIQVTTPLKSRPYVDLTLDIMREFRVKAKNDGYKIFSIPQEQTYKATEYAVEGDYSSAAFLAGAAAATNSEIRILNLKETSKQADKKILEIVEGMGAKVEARSDSVTVRGSGSLSGVTVDLSDSPDLLPIVSALGAIASGKTVIENTAHARLKECDRIRAMAVELQKMGARVKEKEDGLEITGGALSGARLEGWCDHRIVMALSVAALRAKGKTTINDAEMIPVTFPNYVETMQKLGAKIRYVK